jgi:hypothetical protein
LVDAESIATRLDRLTPLLEELEKIRAAGHDAYTAEFRSRLAADHAIQLAIQICIDVGAHLIAELGLEVPSEYRGVFENLRKAASTPSWRIDWPTRRGCAMSSSTTTSKSMTRQSGTLSAVLTNCASSLPSPSASFPLETLFRAP